MPRINITCDQCQKYVGDEKYAWFSNAKNNLDFCSKECCSKYYNINNVISVNDIQTGSKLQLTIKGIEIPSYFSNRGDVWIINISEGIKYGDTGNHIIINEIDFFDNIYSLEKQWLSDTDSFYFFVHYLDKLVELQIGNKSAEVKKVDGENSIVFSLGDGRNISQDRSSVLEIIQQEKKRWDSLGYTMDFLKNGDYLRNYSYIENCKKLINTIYTDKTDEKMTKLNIGDKNLEGSLDLFDFISLKKVNCSVNNLTTLNLSKCHYLEKLICSYNKLTDIILPNNPTNLKVLDLGNNNFPAQSLFFLIPYANLEELDLSNNKFTGSLSYLSGMKKLKELDISDTDIDRGLGHLPTSIVELKCSFEMRPEARVSDIWEELQSFESKNTEDRLKKWREVKLDKTSPLATSPLLPPQLSNEIRQENKVWENYGVPNLDYSEIVYFNAWKKIDKNQNLSPEKLPTKLYNIEKNYIENFKLGEITSTKTGETKKGIVSSNVKNYAIISYVWGNPNVKTNKEIKKMSWWKEKLTILGNKALYKATNACKCQDLGINHIWLDQLCINQNDDAEKTYEVSKMRQYYSNATVTLISINTELVNLDNINLMDILKLIVNSEWFTRSWTYQEGWLSKQTIFMFDDKLIDGRAMAGVWALNQLPYANEGKYNSRGEFDKGSKKIATPLGWVYYRDSYDENDKVEMTLNQALKAIKNRKRGVPVDGIYSILGLLSYGNQVKPKYKKFGENYTKEELEEALLDVMKIANENGYAEPIAWHGQGDGWMPKIDEDGSTSIEGGINITQETKPNVRTHAFLNKESFYLIKGVACYVILEAKTSTQKIEEGFEIEEGLYKKDVKIKGSEKEFNEITLFGTKKTLELAQKDKILILFSREYYKSNKSFALLVEKSKKYAKQGKTNIYCRLGLVELGNEGKLKGRRDGEVVINAPNFQLDNEEFSAFGLCYQCRQPNTSENWCHPCAEKGWREDIKSLNGQEVIEKFIKEQPVSIFGAKEKLKLIPYEQFTNIEYLAQGGFGKVYKAKWEKDNEQDSSSSVIKSVGSNKEFALKKLSNSNDSRVISEFLNEIVNSRLIDNCENIVDCYGISQDPNTGDYLMVMDYIEDGNLRGYLKSKNSELSFKDKLVILLSIATGLQETHNQGLIHRDFHSGNILISDKNGYIADFGLSQPTSYQKDKDKIFGVLPYVAPEVLRGQSYTQASDIYSFGIIAYELFSGESPYDNSYHDTNLVINICQGLRPEISKIPIPELLKDLIKRCWDSDPKKRLSSGELKDDVKSWYKENINKLKKNTKFYHQYQEIKEKYNHFSKNIYSYEKLSQVISSHLLNFEARDELSEQQSQIQIPPK